MSQKRMFSLKIVDSDAFLEMPLSSQCLYFQLCMRADDDGMIGNINRIISWIGASEKDLKLLLNKRFLLQFDSGVVVVKHWKIHNTIQKDRYTRTSYTEEFSMLQTKENKSYTFKDDVYNKESKCFQDVSEDKNSKDKNSKGKNTKDIAEFFEECWKAYPNKKGKGQITDSRKKKLFEEVGKEQMLRCIERFKTEKIGTDIRYIMHGSTFFNSGYVDYLDENYSGSISTPSYKSLVDDEGWQ